MADDTQTADEPTTPTAYGYCHWHENYARGVRLIRAVEQGSGVGANFFACPTCLTTYDLTPLADLPL
jgi:hypothetical protein